MHYIPFLIEEIIIIINSYENFLNDYLDWDCNSDYNSKEIYISSKEFKVIINL